MESVHIVQIAISLQEQRYFKLRFLYQIAKKLNIHSERVKKFQCMSYRFGTIPNIYSLDFPQFLILLDLFPMQKDAGCFGVEIPPYY